MRKIFLLFSVLFILCSAVVFADDYENVTVITIKNARDTSYEKDPETGNETIVLEGSVKLSIEKDGTVSDISADRITYNRETEMLFAKGNVSIATKGEASGGENVSAESLLLNTATLEGIFNGSRVVQTKSDALNLPSGSTLIVFAESFGRSNSNVIAFKNSSLTFCDAENPHWHIDSTRTWLLPGGEFAFFNALLYIGAVPVMYLPAFYYPKDELLFNPVFSIRDKEGYSVQTTTYLYGRKGLEQSSSNKSSSKEDDKISSEALYNFMKPASLKEQRREGLMLHNLNEDYKGDTSEYFKILADFYSNLGFFVGVDGKFRPSKEYITDLSFFLNLGFSNTVFERKRDGKFTPFSPTGKKYMDSSAFLGLKLPFRYGANLNLTLSKPFRLSVSMPIYSDPFFAGDFKNNRQETMDWISFLLDDGKDGDNSNRAETSSFAWNLSAAYSPILPDLLRPYLNSISLSLDSSVNFSIKSVIMDKSNYQGFNVVDSDWSDWQKYTPLSKFYYPSYVNPVRFRASVSGELFRWPVNKKKAAISTFRDFPVPLNKPDDFKTKQEREKEKAAEEAENKEKEIEDKKSNKETDENNKGRADIKDEFEFYNPKLQLTTPAITNMPGLNFNIGYTFNPDLSTQMSYSGNNLTKPEDFNWKDIHSFMYTFKMPLSFSGNLNYRQNFFVMENRLSYDPVFQKHPFISTDKKTGVGSKKDVDNMKESDYKAERQDITSYNYFSFKPFIYFDMLKDTSLSWKTNVKLFESRFTGTADKPEWEPKFFDFKDEKLVTENNLSLNIAVSELENKFAQSLSMSFIMPPLLSQYNMKFNFKFPYVNASFDFGGYEVYKDSASKTKEWKKRNFNQSLSVSLFNSTLSFSESYAHNIEKKRAERLNFSSSWKGLNISFLMSNTYGYDLKDKGWKRRDKEEFLPTSLSISYNTPSKTFSFFSNRISITPGLSTNIVADFLIPTNSYLMFSPSISLKITDSLTMKFSSISKNSVLYWYFHNEPGDLYSDWGGFPGNIIKDLFDSFRFDNNSIREGSGFKMKSVNFELEHDLHDWKLNMSLKVEPRIEIKNGKKIYNYHPYFTLGIVWKPMDSLKTQITDKYGEWEIK